MVLRQLKPYTVLITATGETPITLVLHPTLLGVGIALLLGVPAAWITALTWHNRQLAHHNDTLTETATEILTELEVIGSEIEVLKNRAGLPEEDAWDAVTPAAQATPQGGVAPVAPAATLLESAKQKMPGLEATLSTTVKPALEAQLASEAQQKAAFPRGKPLAGALQISSEFGLRLNPFGQRSYEMHDGIDFAGPLGKPVLATAEGVVVKADYDSGYGNHVRIDHGYNYETLYAHLARLDVKLGDRVRRGAVVGYLGNTGRSSGPHLHYSIYRNGQAVNPRYYLKLEDTE
ncbi:MAG TPA: M23 family metallopeptidase [Leptolyngbyaceae cyanobacterium M65_K2018_010]|nr:M23 family metallopeptidase [Leptolyngbyaceae cyanobacterium M65_K2018_010]